MRISEKPTRRGNESNKMEGVPCSRSSTKSEKESDVVGSGTNSYGKFFMCGDRGARLGRRLEMDVSRGICRRPRWSSESLRAHAAPPVAAPASDPRGVASRKGCGAGGRPETTR